MSLVRQLEVHRDLRLDLDRLAVEQVRLVFPLLDSIGGSSGQLRIPAQNLDVRDLSSLGDRCL